MMKTPNRPNTQNTDGQLPDDIVLTADEVEEFGIEEAPTDIGLSIEEMATSDGGHQHG